VPLDAGDLLAGRWEDLTGAGEWSGELSFVPFRRGSVRLMIGDLLHEESPSKTLLPLADGAGLALIWAPFCEEEASPSWQDSCELEDAENGSRMPVWCDGGLLGRYRKAYNRHFTLWTGEAHRLGIRMARVAAGGSLHEALLRVAGENQAIRLNC